MESPQGPQGPQGPQAFHRYSRSPAGGALRAYAAATVAAVVLSRHIGVCAVKGQLALLARCDDAVGRPAGGL